MSKPILEAHGICKEYPDGHNVCRVLHDIDLVVERGEFLAIMGPSGCGKTTLLNVLGLLTSPSQAEHLRVDEVDCLTLSDQRRTALRRDKIGFVFQRFNLLGTVSAAENIRLALRIKGMSVDGQADSILARVGLTSVGHRKPGNLSIGEQQRAAIARAVACRPVLLLADEPTGNLDSTNAQAVLDLFREFHEEDGLSVVMITHSPECAAAADRILHMKDGRFVD